MDRAGSISGPAAWHARRNAAQHSRGDANMNAMHRPAITNPRKPMSPLPFVFGGIAVLGLGVGVCVLSAVALALVQDSSAYPVGDEVRRETFNAYDPASITMGGDGSDMTETRLWAEVHITQVDPELRLEGWIACGDPAASTVPVENPISIVVSEDEPRVADYQRSQSGPSTYEIRTQVMISERYFSSYEPSVDCMVRLEPRGGILQTGNLVVRID
jgi:hypothetical protein